MAGQGTSPAFIAWGSYDHGKPRVRLLFDALRGLGVSVSEIHIDIWRGIEDKSVAGWMRLAGALIRLILGYPRALYRLLKTPSDRIILLAYPAIADIFVVWLFARLRRQTIVFDAFIPFYDTIVVDRNRLRPGAIAARLLWQFERLALKLADVILVDTDAHGRYFADSFDIQSEKFVTVLVGAEELFWNARTNDSPGDLPVDIPSPYILFYGQFIPLHGVETILRAVELSASQNFHWLIIGQGQEQKLVEDFVAEHRPRNMTWLPWVDYRDLPALIRKAAVCLGIFGASDKAARVVPNKMFQVLAAGGTIITRDSPAVAELAGKFPNTIKLVPSNDPKALAEAAGQMLDGGNNASSVPEEVRTSLSSASGVQLLLRTAGCEG